MNCGNSMVKISTGGNAKLVANAHPVAGPLSARGEYYRTYGKCVTVLLEEFDHYKVTNGQIVFAYQSAADRYNAAAAAVTPTVKRLTELKEERKALMQSQLKRWLHIVDVIH